MRLYPRQNIIRYQLSKGNKIVKPAQAAYHGCYVGRSSQQYSTNANLNERNSLLRSNSLVLRHPNIVKRYLSSQHQPKLAYEWIVDGKVIPSSKMDVSNDKEVIVFLHGLLGNAKNLRTPAKKLTQQLPHLNALLIDIRGHGNSSTPSPTSSSQFSQPHNFHHCVQDICRTLSGLGLTGLNSPTSICGHSLGGRIALQYSHTLCASTNQQKQLIIGNNEVIAPPKQTWVLDSVPGQADPSVHNVLRAISMLPTPIPSKAWLIETLVKDHKMNKGIAMWIATNLRDRGDKSFDWIFDLSIANELVENFSDQNFTEMIHNITTSADSTNKHTSMVQLVMAGNNKLWSKEIVAELQSIPSSLFQMHTLEKAGHWVHVDDLEGLLKLMVDGLR